MGTRRGRYPLMVAVLVLTGCASAVAGSAETPRVWGWVEKAVVMPLRATVKAKLDTGALTSSIHAEEVERFQRDDQEWIRFRMVFEDLASGERSTRELERPLYRNLRVRGAAGSERRPVVILRLCMGDTVYEEQFSLNDRSDMNYPVLLGRRTIRHLGMLDVRRTFLSEPRCDDDSRLQAFDDDRGAAVQES